MTALRSPRLWWVLAVAAPLAQTAVFFNRAPADTQIGMDFRLTWTLALAWREGRDPYNDAVLKSIWLHRGEPRVTPPGLPQTPNVYPLTVAPLLAPLTFLDYRAALAGWLTLNAALVASVLFAVLRAGHGSPVALVAFALLLLGFPLRYGHSFGNLAVPASALAFHAIRLRSRPVQAGLMLGLSLVKYSLAGPLALYFLARRRFRLVAVAGAVQLALVALATAGAGRPNPLPWIEAMQRSALASLAPGQINHHAGLDHTALHLELAALLYLLSPALDRFAPFIVALLLAALLAGLLRRPPGDAPIDVAHVAILAVTLLAFYHRTYDLIVVLFPLMALLASRPLNRTAAICWLGALLASLPGATVRGGNPSDAWLVTAVIQPIAVWGLLLIAVALLARLWVRPPT